MRSNDRTPAFDPDGNLFLCPRCGGQVMDDHINDQQICSACGHVITHEEFENMLRDWDIRTGGDGNIYG